MLELKSDTLAANYSLVFIGLYRLYFIQHNSELCWILRDVSCQPVNIIIINIIKNECHSNIIVDRLQGCEKHYDA